ncbi:amino acid permease-domain-containing protein, partial [Blastocladiella britannica]
MAIVISGIGLLSIYVGLLASNRLVATAPAIFAGFPGQLSVNFGPHFEDAAASMPVSSSVAPPTWASQFGLFFPCVTGMMSGANKSGGVHNPSRAIPRGTLAAILASAAIYLSAILLVGTVMYGEALRTMAPSRPGRDVPPPLLAFAQVSWPAEWLGYMATVAAALGAAMQATTAANRVMRAMVRDGILGLNHVLTTQLRAAVLTFVISAAVVLVGNLDAVAPITTMCYLLAYAALNLGTALGGFTHAPTWRPTWKYFHWAVSLSGAMLCITLMFVLSWWIALGALTAALILYYAVQLHGASGQWGYDGWWSFAMQVARQNLWRLESMSITAGTWRPQIIALIPPDETAARPEGENNDLSHGLSVSAS